MKFPFVVHKMYSTLKIIVIFTFIIQIIMAIQIFQKRRRHHSNSANNQPVIIILNQASSPSQQVQNDGVSMLSNKTIQQVISTHNQHSNQGAPKRVQKSLILGTIFLLTFLFINHLLRPFTFAWIPILLPILMVIPFLILPSYRDMKSFTTFFTLAFGIGLGGFCLFLLL